MQLRPLSRLVRDRRLLGGAVLALAALRAAASELPADNWPCVGGDPGGMRYSTLAQICRENVADLQVAWTYRTGELENGAGRTIECTPIVVDGVMYVTTGKLHVVALDAATGKQLWRYDPFAQGVPQTLLASGGVNRGVAYWSDGQPGGQRRILFGCASGHLISLDAATGTPDPGFGRVGVKDLREDLAGAADGLPYGPTSAPAVCRDRVIVGFSCGEGPGRAAPGDIRAFDVRTGAQLWRFHTVPRPGEAGHETWAADAWKARGAANAWGGVTVDVEAGVAYVATGSAAFDFYGGDRHGANLFANCTLALDAQTGERRWHFQTLHHDLWDHDLPVSPNLVHVTRDGRRIPAVAQVTKTGHLFLFERASGAPLFDVRETPVPASDVPGEAAWPTQPIPVQPPPFAVQGMSRDDVTDIGPANRAFVLERLRRLRAEPYAPPSLQGTVVAPGFHGGANWSGACFDPETETLYVNSNNVPNVLTLEPAEPGATLPYRHTGYIQFLDQEGYPASKPPWGLLNAIDLRRGDFAWRATLGEFAELTARGVPPTGTETFGGSIVTAGGLTFIGGTKDEKFRAFDKTSGRVLWEAQLPAGGYATPCTYAVGGRQFVAIAAGGAGKLGTRAGDAIVCFALPNATDGAQRTRVSR